MKFFVAQDEQIEFSFDACGKSGRFSMKYHVDDGELDEFDKGISSVLKGMVDFHPRMTILKLSMNPKLMCKGTLTFGEDKERFLKDVSTLFGEDNVRVKVSLSFSPTPSSRENKDNPSDTTDNCLSTEAMEITSGNSTRPWLCMDNNVQFPNSAIWKQFIDPKKAIDAFLTVEVTVNTRIRAKAIKNNLFEKMLHDEVHCDLTITAGNGNKINCHKSVLSACSPVFGAMFKADMEESQTQNIDLTDMSEQCVKSFLNYVYYMNEDEPRKDCDIAFELLSAAHKYDVTPDMETAMINLILSKPIEWFSVDVGVKIFLLAGNIPNNGNVLKEKAVQVLKKNFAALSESEAFTKMFEENPSAALEFSQLVMG